MEIRETVNDISIKKLFERYKEAHGRMNFTFVYAEGNFSQIEGHRATAMYSIHKLKKEIDEYYKKLSLNTGEPRECYFQMIVDDKYINEFKCRSLTLEQFFGPYYNVKTGRLIMRGFTKCGQGIHAYYDAPETVENALYDWELPGYGFYKYTSQGYTGAFLDMPCYHISSSFKSRYETGRFFLEFNKEVFSDLDAISIYEWDTNCSNYFDRGKEWWGSYFWTIYNPIKNIFISIIVSDTD